MVSRTMKSIFDAMKVLHNFVFVTVLTDTVAVIVLTLYSLCIIHSNYAWGKTREDDNC